MSEFIEITEPTLILSISVLCPDMEPDIYEATRYAVDRQLPPIPQTSAFSDLNLPSELELGK